VTSLELKEFPSVTWAVRSLKSHSPCCKCLGDILVSRAGLEFLGARRCRTPPLCPVLEDSTKVQIFCCAQRILKQSLRRPLWTGGQ